VVLAAAAAAAATYWPSPGTPAAHQVTARPTQLTRAAGRIAIIAPLGALEISSPDGQHVKKVPALSDAGYPLLVSPDNRYLSEGNGQVITAPSQGLPAVIKTPIALWPYQVESPDAGPFADHDRYLVGTYQGGFGSESDRNPVLYSLATGHRIKFGAAHHIAGDPQSAGVFSSTAGKVLATTGVTTAIPDTNVVLQRAGHRPQVLATDAELQRDLHRKGGQAAQKASQGAELVPYPSPSGDAVAITVTPQDGSRDPGVVILSRSGRILGDVPTTDGPIPSAAPAWSPSGSALAFVGSGPGGPALYIWTRAGNKVHRYPFPSATAGQYKFCLWSPDGQSLLCSADHPAQQWVIATMPGHTMTPLHGPGTPVAWLP
jgi:hypothetical protein